MIDHCPLCKTQLIFEDLNDIRGYNLLACNSITIEFSSKLQYSHFSIRVENSNRDEFNDGVNWHISKDLSFHYPFSEMQIKMHRLDGYSMINASPQSMDEFISICQNAEQNIRMKTRTELLDFLSDRKLGIELKLKESIQFLTTSALTMSFELGVSSSDPTLLSNFALPLDQATQYLSSIYELHRQFMAINILLSKVTNDKSNCYSFGDLVTCYNPHSSLHKSLQLFLGDE